MLELSSKTLKEYYGEKPSDYNIKFCHYSYDILEETSEEYRAIKKDLKNIKEYVGDEYFKLYFGEVDTLQKLNNMCNILDDYLDFIYVRVRNENEYKNLNRVVGNLPIKIIVEKDNLKYIKSLKYDNLYDVVLQIDTIKELSPTQLNKLKALYNIEDILVGQWCGLSSYFEDYYDRQEYKYKIKKLKNGSKDYTTIEKNAVIYNDIYSFYTYTKLYNKLIDIISAINLKDREDMRFFNVYKKIVNDIDYDDKGFCVLENQNLYSGLMNKSCVCEGFSKILQQALSLVGVESIIIGALDPNGADVGHIWNQVKIDGKWYNADAATDSVRRRRGLEMFAYLIDDEKIYYKTDSPIAKKCEKTYDIDKIKFESLRRKK